MLPDDATDLGIASLIFIGALFIGISVQTLEIFDKSSSLDKISIDDDSELFLINYLRTEADRGRISDMILKAENDEETFEKLKEKTEEIMDFGFVEEYDIRFIYPTGERKINNVEFNEFKEMKLPLSNGGVVLIKAGFKFDEKF